MKKSFLVLMLTLISGILLSSSPANARVSVHLNVGVPSYPVYYSPYRYYEEEEVYEPRVYVIDRPVYAYPEDYPYRHHHHYYRPVYIQEYGHSPFRSGYRYNPRR
jgi:hypothetical protein